MKTSISIKKFIAGKTAVILLSGMIFSECSMAQNLITNPGFTNGTTGWNTQCSIEINPESVYGGNGSNPVTEIDVERCFNQEVPVTTGTIYDFGFKASRRQGGTPATVGITVTVTGIPSGTVYVNSNYTYTNTSWAYTTETGSFTVSANSGDTKVNIRFSNYLTSGTYGTLVDDINLQTSSMNVILPIKLKDFKGEIKNNKPVLEWTANNDNNDGKYFIIEKAVNGTFDSVGRVEVSPVAGTQSYSFIDNKSSEDVNNYRLKIVNRAGFTYSRIISINNNIIHHVQVYPNPATSSINLKLNNAPKGTLNIQVYSITGSIMINKNQSVSAGTNSVSLDISSLQAGSFFVKITENDGNGYAQSFCKK